MTTSDLERTLAEARAAAARRLEALRDAQKQPATGVHGQSPAAEPVIVARREPAPHAGQAAPEVAMVPPRQGRRPDQPDVAAASVTPFEAPSPPLVGHAVPIQGDLNEVPANELEYAAYEPVGAPRDAGDTVGYVPVDPLPRARPEVQGATATFQEAQFDEPRRQSGFMAGLMAGIAGFRRSRAERRLLARENALQSADAATPPPRNQRLTAREQRWERRRKRHLFEEILGWILVPAILVACYFFAMWVLDLVGVSPEMLMEGIRTIWSQLG